MIRHQLLVCHSKWKVFLKIFWPPSVWVFELIEKVGLQKSTKFWSFLNEGDKRYPDFVLFVVYIVFLISIFLQGWVRHSYHTIPHYCQYFPNLKINYKKKLAFVLKFHAFALLMHFMNRFCCRLWASRLTNIFPLMKNFVIFNGNIQKSHISRKIKFRENCNLWGFDLQKYLPRKFPGRH